MQITVAETVGVEERGAFYEPTGALRDMVPNHLFSLLCMIAMEPPNSFAAEGVRTERTKLVQAIRPLRLAEAVRGRYAAGEESGTAVPAYRAEPHVAKDSRTEISIHYKPAPYRIFQDTIVHATRPMWSGWRSIRNRSSTLSLMPRCQGLR